MSVTEEALAGEDRWVNEIIARVQPYTMTGPEKIAGVCHAIEYIVRCRIPGDIVECGVWKGGSIMAAALSLLKMGDDQRMLYLYDTFEGMPAPTDVDKILTSGIAARDVLGASPIGADTPWVRVPLYEVQANVLGVGYPSSRISFVKGRVEDTLPSGAPPVIALLRLDTDWYESTHHELTHLYPRLAIGGVLIVDDYGYWAGSRLATDQYVREHSLQLMLTRIGQFGRIAVKQGVI